MMLVDITGAETRQWSVAHLSPLNTSANEPESNASIGLGLTNKFEGRDKFTNMESANNED